MAVNSKGEPREAYTRVIRSQQTISLSAFNGLDGVRVRYYPGDDVYRVFVFGQHEATIDVDADAIEDYASAIDKRHKTTARMRRFHGGKFTLQAIRNAKRLQRHNCLPCVGYKVVANKLGVSVNRARHIVVVAERSNLVSVDRTGRQAAIDFTHQWRNYYASQ